MLTLEPVAVARINGGKFAPGTSGNPGGRKHGPDVSALAREHTAAAIAALVKALEVPRERVQAAQILLDRGWGKAVQQIETTHGDSIHLHLIAARDVAAIIDHTATPIDAKPQRVVATIDAPTPTE